mmetsp:Transcript_45148/g.94703  ORF Transcript_45148/g.94703 Transcript_45148/m.94703 type:complete len:268 (-) Transcript_45148:652-1455(-)|eukprot:CAMPEP_0183737818 /NCGR_PEP_ID=MMETSP0737-20130205/53037_1 /TAXON_ID=385413 /ORGANISM="Thalassiosira miniscula, Strain CCMP1093" /LENGTH=267 /DNA_ID=CAMNT_0025972201 /DNA_START=44 /DNA_END=847 /DNA_ORIENTATION=-
MPIIAVTAIKPRADTKLGVTCTMCVGKPVVVKKVDADGIFGGTDLTRGQEVLRINETPVENIGTDAMFAILSSLPSGEVTFIVKSEKCSIDGVTFQCAVDHNGESVSIMNTSIEIIPQVLRDASVPREHWLLIYSLIEHELMPVSAKCIQSNEIYNRDMRDYNHTSLTLEKNAHMKGVQTGILHNNVTLVAMSVKDRVNSILANYHVIAALAYKSIELPPYPGQRNPSHISIAVGLNFYKIRHSAVEVTATPLESVKSVIATPVCEF